MIRVSSRFGPRINPVTHEAHVHTGIDLPAPIGTPVRACYGGSVARIDVEGVGRGTVNGNAVHVSGPAGWVWSYLHLSRVLVRVGQQVLAGELVGLVGATGRATGPHLHLQVTHAGEPVDPIPLFPEGVFYGP